MTTLWFVEIHDDDWDYDNFESAVVWADTTEEAEDIIRAEHRYDGRNLWIEDPLWRLTVKPAPTEGVAHIHWHAG